MRLFYIIILPLIVSLAISSESGLLKMNSFDLEAVLLEDQNRQPGTPERYACLLYTSPSPRDRTRSRMPSSA